MDTRKLAPTTPLSEWPPDDYAPSSGYWRTTGQPVSISTPHVASSFISSVSLEPEPLSPQLDTWLQNHGKVFHNTPLLPNIGDRPEAGPLCGPAPVADEATPIVIRGANCQAATDGPSVSVDWLRFSGPSAQRHKAVALLETFFGESKPGRGRFFLNSSYQFSTGGIFFDSGEDAKSTMVIEMPSSLLAELDDPAQVQQVARELHDLGCKCIRADIAVDFYDQPNLIDLALQSCEDGHLTGSKTFTLIYGKSSRRSTGRTLNIGKRGKEGSGRFLRIYDKGLETKTRNANEWIRWEAELSDDCAAQFIAEFIDQSEPTGTSISHAMGVCDFREDPERRLSRRPRCAWFQSLLGEVTPTTVKARRVASNIYTKVRWFQTCVAPALRTIQHVTGHTLDHVMHHITGAVRPKQSKLQDIFVREVCSSLGVQPHQLHYQFSTSGGLIHG